MGVYQEQSGGSSFLPRIYYKPSGSAINCSAKKGDPGAVPVINPQTKQPVVSDTGEPFYKIEHPGGLYGRIVDIERKPSVGNIPAQLCIFMYHEGDKNISVLQMAFDSVHASKFFATEPNIDYAKPVLIKVTLSGKEGEKKNTMFIQQGEKNENGYIPSLKQFYSAATPHDRPAPIQETDEDGKTTWNFKAQTTWHARVRMEAIRKRMSETWGTTYALEPLKDKEGNPVLTSKGEPVMRYAATYKEGHAMTLRTSEQPTPTPAPVVTPTAQEQLAQKFDTKPLTIPGEDFGESDDLPF